MDECLRVLKKDGLLAVAYINKYSILPMLVTRDQRFIRDSVVEKVIEQGVIHEGDEDCFWTDAHFSSPDEIELFMNQRKVKPLDHVGTDGLSHTISEEVDRLGDAEFEAWVRYHLKTCRESSILGVSSHGLYVCQKQS